MPWRKMLAYLTGSVDQEFLLRNEFLAAENRILRSKIQGRLLLTDAERTCLAGIGKRLVLTIESGKQPGRSAAGHALAGFSTSTTGGPDE